MNAALQQSFLDDVRVAAPCPASWEAMQGDERVRFCPQCKLNVYNLSGMSRREAEELVRSRVGRLCIRFYRRADGTLLTDNCPVGLRAARRKLALLLGAAAFVFAWGAGASRGQRNGQASLRSVEPFKTLQGHEPFRTVIDWIDPVQPIQPIRPLAPHIMGGMAESLPPAPNGAAPGGAGNSQSTNR